MNEEETLQAQIDMRYGSPAKPALIQPTELHTPMEMLEAMQRYVDAGDGILRYFRAQSHAYGELVAQLCVNWMNVGQKLVYSPEPLNAETLASEKELYELYPGCPVQWIFRRGDYALACVTQNNRDGPQCLLLSGARECRDEELRWLYGRQLGFS